MVGKCGAEEDEDRPILKRHVTKLYDRVSETITDNFCLRSTDTKAYFAHSGGDVIKKVLSFGKCFSQKSYIISIIKVLNR